jgi:hypothetical protein
MPAEKVITIPGSLIGGALPHVANQETSDETARGKVRNVFILIEEGATIGMFGIKYQHYFNYLHNQDMTNSTRTAKSPH